MPNRVDWWTIAQDLLYPHRTYRSLRKGERFRVTELARRMSDVGHQKEPPPVDDEIYAILEQHNRPNLADRNGQLWLVGFSD